MIDVTTLNGLQIFHEEMHPSIVGIGRSKEGFSVFGMMDRCLTLAVGLSRLIHRGHRFSLSRDGDCCMDGF